MMTSNAPRRLSWRDPAGFVIREGHRILRAVHPDHIPVTERLLASEWLQAHMRDGRISRSWWTEDGPEERGIDAGSAGRWLEHDRVEFPVYPHEISALQLYDAAQLTLRLALDALEHGWMMKDGTAWNILFTPQGPIFCDLLSFEPLIASETWSGYAQFQRTFTIPLLLSKHRGIAPRTWFLAEREGVTPEAARDLLSGLAAWRQPALEAVTLPTLFAGLGQRARSASADAPTPPSRPEVQRHILRSTLKRLVRHVERLKPGSRSSKWSHYRATRDHYSDVDLRLKEDYVRKALSTSTIHNVLDIGCNTGEYSELAAALGKLVVAIDLDDESVQRLYASTRRSRAAVSALVVNIAHPTPSLGWLNSEVPAFLERATGYFDGVLALGLVHHLLVTERASLAQIAELFARLSAHMLVIEWVDPGDPRFLELAGPNLPLYTGVTREAFEAAFSRHFALKTRVPLPQRRTRTLYTWIRETR
jgi:SAM-dependent methyltransferase